MDRTAAGIVGGCLILSVMILVVGMNMAARSLGDDLKEAGRNARASVHVPGSIYHQWDQNSPLKIETIGN